MYYSYLFNSSRTISKILSARTICMQLFLVSLHSYKELVVILDSPFSPTSRSLNTFKCMFVNFRNVCGYKDPSRYAINKTVKVSIFAIVAMFSVRKLKVTMRWAGQASPRLTMRFSVHLPNPSHSHFIDIWVCLSPWVCADAFVHAHE